MLISRELQPVRSMRHVDTWSVEEKIDVLRFLSSGGGILCIFLEPARTW